MVQAVLGEVVLVVYLFAVTYWRPYMARADNLLAMGSLFGERIHVLASTLALQMPWTLLVHARACAQQPTTTIIKADKAWLHNMHKS